jgi:MSHA pilin protein MshC
MRCKKKEPNGSFFYRRPRLGFTLMELITILVIVSILAVAAVPRFWGAVFDQAEFRDQTLAALRYAQRAAMAYERTVCATFTGTQLVLTYASAYGSAICDTNLLAPGGGSSPYTVNAPSSVTYTAASSFTFDRIGRPSVGQAILISGGGSVTVEADSGYVH